MITLCTPHGYRNMHIIIRIAFILCFISGLISFAKGMAISSCINDFPWTKNGYFKSLQKVVQIKYETNALEYQTQYNQGVKMCTQKVNAEKPHIEEELFEFQEVKDREILVFSAFHEKRENAGGPAIRVIAVGLQGAYHDIGPLWCTLWYYNRKEGISVEAKYENIYPSLLHHDMWCEHFILCPLPKEIEDIPYAVSVTHELCAVSQNALYVANHGVETKKGKHSICYPVMYGRFQDWSMLVEFFELQRLLGAEEITIYNYSVSEETSKTLHYFKRQGLVTVIPWPYPKLPTHVFFQRAALNDCIYRNMHRYDYVAVHDLDEVLVPRLSSTWTELLDTINKPDSPDYGVFMFQHLYFRRNTTKPKNINQNQNLEDLFSKDAMITLSSFYRTHQVTPPGKIRCKSMYKPEKVLKLDLHFPYKLVPGAEEYLVDPHEGVLHHYRVDPLTSFAKHPERYTYIEDRHLELYSKEHMKSYRKHLKKILELL